SAVPACSALRVVLKPDCERAVCQKTSTKITTMNDEGDSQLKHALALDERPFRGSERPPPFPIAAQEGFDRRAPFEERKDFSGSSFKLFLDAILPAEQVLESHEITESRTGRRGQPHNTTFTHTSSRFPVHSTISKDLTTSGDARRASQLAELGHKLSHCSTDGYQTQFGRKRKLSENDGSPYRPSSSALNNRYYEPYEDGQRSSNSRLTNEPAHTPLGHRKI
ncbi:hypothetical protein RB213_011669, partial [Colletotrichum asianum]